MQPRYQQCKGAIDNASQLELMRENAFHCNAQEGRVQWLEVRAHIAMNFLTFRANIAMCRPQDLQRQQAAGDNRRGQPVSPIVSIFIASIDI
jgi:hypothetical protein